jgi:hypothetical protein
MSFFLNAAPDRGETVIANLVKDYDQFPVIVKSYIGLMSFYTFLMV